MIGLNVKMPSSCLECPCGVGTGIWTKDGTYDALCYAKKPVQTFVYKDVPIGTRPTDCPLIDLSRYEDDLK